MIVVESMIYLSSVRLNSSGWYYACTTRPRGTRDEDPPGRTLPSVGAFICLIAAGSTLHLKTLISGLGCAIVRALHSLQALR